MTLPKISKKSTPQRYAVFEYIKANPQGATAEQIAKALGYDWPQSVCHALEKLRASGHITRHRIGRWFHYHPASVPLKSVQQPVTVAELPADTGEVEALRAQVAELEAWKAAAIAKHADLKPVDPMLIRARRIVAQMYNESDFPGVSPARVLEGHYDSDVVVQAVLAALSDQQEA